MSRRQSFLAAAALVGATVTARAQTVAGESVAQVLFERARDDMRHGAYDDARAKLAESERLDPSNGTLLNLVVCEEKLGLFASALLHVHELLDQLSQDDERRPIAERKAAFLTPRVPLIEVRLAPGAPPGTTVSLDGVALGTTSLGVPLPVDPGLHHLAARSPDGSARLEDVRVEEAQHYELLLQPPATMPTRPAPSSADVARAPERRPTTPHPRSGDKWVGWTALGIGAAGLVVGGVLGGLTLHQRAVVESTCPNKACRDASGVSAAEAGQRLFVGTMTALGVGAVGTGLGAYLLLSPTPAEHAQQAASFASGSGVVATYAGRF
ncbi:MAG TPA: hypothetical protein VHC69_19585 [Polyangiaceae bacterium]|nr:hypothetical protein [Polyangiaceae bacterium]